MPFVASSLENAQPSVLDDASPRKRRKLSSVDREPLTSVAANGRQNTFAGFVLDDSDEDDDRIWDPSAKPPAISANNRRCVEQDINAVTTSTLPYADKTSKRLNSNSPVTGAADLISSHSESPPSLELTTQSTIINSSGNERRQNPFANNLDASIVARSSSGYVLSIRQKKKQQTFSYQRTIADRTNTGVDGLGQKSYYGVDVHRLMEDASETISKVKANHAGKSSVPQAIPDKSSVVCLEAKESSKSLMWTEKYRANKFTDLIGDERTHRAVLKWLKAWDPIVFPGAARLKQRRRHSQEDQFSELQHKKVLLISGPPGLGKTTLAHVCARQAGYEVQEINASDDRNRDVVKGKIRDMVGTETIKKVGETSIGASKSSARPVCVVVDEVDGVTSGTSEGLEGGFIKALIDLIALDQKNIGVARFRGNDHEPQKRKRVDKFRLLRPLILICNDLYHPSLRLLRQSNMVELIFARRPPLNLIVPRVQHIFENEGVLCDGDGIRRLCEATWGVGGRDCSKSADGLGEGDFRSILVVSEWVASKLRGEVSVETNQTRLTKRWVEQNVLKDLAYGGECSRSLGKGGSRQLVDRIFAYNAGFPSTTPGPRAPGARLYTNSYENAGGRTIERLREIIARNCEEDRALTDCFATYLSLPYQDDTFLTKPGRIYDWLHFHDQISSRVLSLQQWDLSAHLPTSLLAFHALFASNSQHSYSNAMKTKMASEDSTADDDTGLFSGLRASYIVSEKKKANYAILQQLQAGLSLPLGRAFGSPEDLAVELIPYVSRMLSPTVKPVIVGGSEKGIASVRRGEEREMVNRSVAAMVACGVRFEKGKIDKADHGKFRDNAGWVYRMDPAIDDLVSFETAGKGIDSTRTRYAVRQVLEQEWKREALRRDQEARVKRMRDSHADEDSQRERPSRLAQESPMSNMMFGHKPPKRSNSQAKDFFGRPVTRTSSSHGPGQAPASGASNVASQGDQDYIGNRNEQTGAHGENSKPVKKGITMKELLEGV